MSGTGNSKWLAVHLYYNEPWEEFLSKAIKPYVDTVVQTGIAEQYFFIRYWERGPHIRLRIKGEQTVIDNIVHANLEEHFQIYFESRPSLRTDPTYPPNFPENYKWYPNNSIQFIPYEQELERFGGIAGMSLAEKQFQFSSDMVLQSIKAKGIEWSYEEALGLAIKLHLSFAHSMGLNFEELKSFFKIIFQNWLPGAFRFYSNKLSRALYQGQEKRTLEAFQKAFKDQESSLIAFHQELWAALEREGEFEDEFLSNWVQQHEELRDEYRLAIEINQLEPRSDFYKLDLAEELPPDKNLLWSFYSDFIHLTNNRLGISNKDEGFIAYLLYRSLDEFKPSSGFKSTPLSKLEE